MKAKWLLLNWPELWDFRNDPADASTYNQVIDLAVKIGYVVCAPQLPEESEWSRSVAMHLFATDRMAADAEKAFLKDTGGLMYHDSPMSPWGMAATSMGRASLFLALGPLGYDQMLLLTVADSQRVPIVTYVPFRKLSELTIADYNVCQTLDRLGLVLRWWEQIVQEKSLIGEE